MRGQSPATDHHIHRMFEARHWLVRGAEEQVSVPQVARRAGISVFHFVRLYRRTFNETPYQTVIGSRLARAKLLLTETDLPITEICFECGYESLGSFSHLFRRETGSSPREFRRQRPRFWPVGMDFVRPMVPFCLLSAFR